MPAPQGSPGPPLAAKGAVTTPPQRSGEWKEGGNSMLALKYLLMILGAALFGSAAALVAYDIFLSEQLRRLLSRGKTDEPGAEVGALARRPFRPVRWRPALQLIAAGGPGFVFAGKLCVGLAGAGGRTRTAGLCARPPPRVVHG